MPLNHKIRGLVGSQNGSNFHSSVRTYLQNPVTNLYTSVVDFIHFRRLVEPALYPVSEGDGEVPLKVSDPHLFNFVVPHPGSP